MHRYRDYHFHNYEKLRWHPADPGMVTFWAIWVCLSVWVTPRKNERRGQTIINIFEAASTVCEFGWIPCICINTSTTVCSLSPIDVSTLVRKRHPGHSFPRHSAHYVEQKWIPIWLFSKGRGNYGISVTGRVEATSQIVQRLTVQK